MKLYFISFHVISRLGLRSSGIFRPLRKRMWLAPEGRNEFQIGTKTTTERKYI
jgi:hypothetical protein